MSRVGEPRCHHHRVDSMRGKSISRAESTGRHLQIPMRSGLSSRMRRCTTKVLHNLSWHNPSLRCPVHRVVFS